ncbi:PREDICTED: uncharacterized protein LOC106805403 [Priapulus caudatus]|uniref:Uncharacterized protein LOC106805403 n=1 Tax=Priapulus caudatus TaxID=37621 RepID=A0ABM1DR91_PRICU|nr:PREDICTED: uncharacterized protein LOC106805403 [Priapulus caudatus]
MTASIPPITVIAWSEFIDTPGLMYGLFSASDGQLRYDESKVIALQTKSEDASYTDIIRALTSCMWSSARLYSEQDLRMAQLGNTFQVPPMKYISLPIDQQRWTSPNCQTFR